MSLRNRKLFYGGFFLVALLLVTVGGGMQKAPGYMDAEYYYAMSVRLAEGKGMTQPFLWNYLDDPPSLIAPSHTFWMPLTSLVAVPGFWVFRSFTGARLIFWLLFALVPPLTVWFGYRFHGDWELAVTGGALALFPVFYGVYLPVTDSFALYMLLGMAFFVMTGWPAGKIEMQAAGLGVVTGLMYMTRPDGLLWLVIALCWLGWKVWNESEQRGKSLLAVGVLCILGFLFVGSFWFARNLMVFHRLLPPGSGRALWLTRYEDLFLYPAQDLTFARWLSGGWGRIGSGIWQAVVTNFQTAVAVQGSIALFPFIGVGMATCWKRSVVKVGLLLWAGIFLMFSLVFPYQGVNGSFFHAGAGVQPFLWVMATVGIQKTVMVVSGWRHWQRGHQVQVFLEVLLVLVCVFLTAGLFLQKIHGGKTGIPWGGGTEAYSQIEMALERLGISPCEPVMVNNPPGYYLATGRAAVVIPFGDETTVRAVSERYGVKYLILDQNNSGHLPDLYFHPGISRGFKFLMRFGDARIYEILP
ncbi:MAG TPA: hypothetical protein DEQ80_08555 [Anaerolinea thermolimosa]|uniref:Glycosyltransferase RgtA/B/C/D-like domain-containing protein n=1 Tax=Anaerolinea thermolimosa TaxID=229919 RepID=A0A3D1JHH1_9CHLR|nr:hypothetical protein [Anaerolinea thermolimosa]